MNRGEIWTSAGGGDFAGKPRPVVVLQNDAFAESTSITVCPVTSNAHDAPLFRIVVQPSPSNGLERVSRLMADRVTTIRRARLHQQIGTLEEEAMAALEDALLVFLGISRTSRS